MPHRALDPSAARPAPPGGQRRETRFGELIQPGAVRPVPATPELAAVAERILAARRAGRPVICMLGPRVITAGLGLLVGDLVRRGLLTHVAAGNAAAARDFELALRGATETADHGWVYGESARLLREAVCRGARDGLGWGEALGRFLAGDPRPTHPEAAVAHSAYTHKCPLTVHATIGSDASFLDPSCDYAALGWASGQDLRILCASARRLAGGVYLSLDAGAAEEAVFAGALAAARASGEDDGP
ncbi:MAG: hypothetical protein QME94_07345, partial [Anaerolineae bacterium]|nr:hypothetical protein [Anaerolineae bacterium]